MRNSIFALLQIKANPLTVNFDKRLVYEFSEHTIDNIVVMDVKTAYRFPGQQNCIMHELYNYNQANECKKQVFNISTTLWSFITPTPTIVYSLCHGQRNNAVLSNIGILHINSTCSVHTPEFILMHEQEKGVFMQTFIKAFKKP